MSDLNEQMESFARMQKAAMEPMKQFNSVAVDAFEKISRQNYSVVGDLMEYTVKQARTPLGGDELKDVLSAQMNNARALSEQMSARANEYSELARELQGAMAEVVKVPETAQ